MTTAPTVGPRDLLPRCLCRWWQVTPLPGAVDEAADGAVVEAAVVAQGAGVGVQAEVVVAASLSLIWGLVLLRPTTMTCTCERA
jgi:hypothetical protein